ncbi:helix-turn-helix domain-containing protein [Azoarcus indigens]|uniref:AraC-like DNA-binding protein n=1 Tax=Azoarcus indigens TaxID=29545 RepID=A0A4R6DMF1_9RHOO|nr:AraC family transcriptional regulator [Azoarcus indigens]NMG66090.1 helix-turn-helix domain-containing protein [Azoarcus indigens]TDN46017.1 AraC-like DNA-binding protein [Azoarcus indigens]
MDEKTEFWRDPALPQVESRRACHSRACYRAHSHPSFSIGAVDEGRSLFTGTAEGPVELRAGTLVFVPPGRVHACNPVDAAWSYQMLHVDARWWQAVRQEAGSQELLPPGEEPVRLRTSAASYTRFCQLNTLLFSDAGPHAKEAALVELIGDYVQEQDDRVVEPVSGAPERRRLQPVFSALKEEAVDALSLGELAALAGMSRYQLIRSFRAASGLTPHAWQLNERINQARDRLRAGDALADIAHRLGFADQSHFQRMFKAHTGVTPGSYRG